MNDADYAAAKSLISDIISRWKKPLDLDLWHIVLYWYRGPISFCPDAAACVPVNKLLWGYQLAEIHFNLEAMFREGADPEEVTVHELLHIVTAKAIRKGKSDHTERVCTVLARALVHAARLGPDL